VEDLGDEGKLGRGFSSIDELEEVGISGGEVRRPHTLT
jgi:ribosomal protein L13E